MAQRKRAGGRVTPSKKQRAALDAAPKGRDVTSRSAGHRFAASSRYTPPKAQYRLRPRWHRVAGWGGLSLGLLIVVVNDAMLFTEHLLLLPFGHNELYLMLGVAVAGTSTWFLGLFDRGTTICD